MRFDEVQRRLRTLGEPAQGDLPAGPTALDPDVLATGTDAPAWVRRSIDTPARDAAVLVLIYPDADDEATLVLTVRPEGDLRHAGQISLPGGAADPGDAFPEGTALREAAEEVGLDPIAADVTIVGRLDIVDVRVSGFLLVPVVALAARAPILTPDSREVAAILHMPVGRFLPDAVIEIVEAERDGWRLRYGAYPFDGHHVWGATARVLGQLGAVLGRDEATS
jgi:8-oxo-dGTP pyrophosphatase MutT (NUDIX family)